MISKAVINIASVFDPKWYYMAVLKKLFFSASQLEISEIFSDSFFNLKSWHLQIWLENGFGIEQIFHFSLNQRHFDSWAVIVSWRQFFRVPNFSSKRQVWQNFLNVLLLLLKIWKKTDQLVSKLRRWSILWAGEQK